MSETQELRTKIVWETGDVDRGLQRVEQAIDRMGKAEQKSVTAQAARDAQAAKQQAQSRERALRDIEKMEKDASERRVSATTAEYKRLEKLDKDRQSQVIQGIRANNARAGISSGGGATAASRAGSGGGAGGHGGAGGGFAGTRMLGDALNAVTGGSGNVMRLNMLSHMGPLLGGAAAIAGLAAKSYAANGEVLQGSEDMKRARGERAESRWAKDDIVGPLMRLLPNAFRPDPTMARSETQSAGGIEAQRQAIEESTKKAQGGRGFFASMYSGVTRGSSMSDSFQEEEKNQNKLIELDQRKSGIIKEQTAARRLALTDGEHAGRIAQIEVEKHEKIATINDQSRDGKLGLAALLLGRSATAVYFVVRM